MKQPLLSIVVPTKNRYGYLKPLVDLIKSFKSTEVELVIEDNSDDNSSFLPYISTEDFNQLHYFYTKESISVRDNLDNAILHSSGKYVCVIGDDDGVMRNILDCVRWMDINNIEAIIPKVISYVWPDHGGVSDPFDDGYVFYTREVSSTPTFLNPNEELMRSIESGFLDRGNLPICYHGIVSRKALNKVYNIGGHFSPGPSPDIAAGVALSFSITKYAYINYPIIISGASAQHGGGAHKMKYGAAEIKDLSFLPSDASITWEKNLPHIWSVETVWPESAIKALRYVNREDLIKKVNFNKIYSVFLIRRYYYRDRLFKVIENKIRFLIFFLPWFSRLAYKYIMRKIFGSKQDSTQVVYKNSLTTIVEAADYLDTQFPNVFANER